MRAFFAIVITSLYLAFSVGLTLHIHQCDDLSMPINEAVLSPMSIVEDDCKMEDSHACCVPEEKTSCCDGPGNSDDCCFESLVLLQIEEEQILTKNYIIEGHPELNKISIRDLSKEYVNVSHEKEILSHPPPLIKDQHIVFCSLTFYG